MMMSVVLKRMNFLVIALLVPLPLHALRVIYTAIPKAGVHVGARCGELLKQRKQFGLWHALKHNPEPTPQQLDEALSCMPDERYTMVHLAYNQEYEPILRKYHCVCIFIMRHPCAIAVSRMHWIKERPNGLSELHSLPAHEVLLKLLGPYPYHLGKSLRDRYLSMLGWRSSPLCCTVRFEDLVGPQGGGSEPAQLLAVSRVARHLGITCSSDRVKKIARDIFGESYTFRRGSINAWRTELNAEHKQMGKEFLGQLIGDLKYGDLSW